MTSKPENRWTILVMLMTAHAVTDGFLWIIPPLLPAIREHFHLSYTEIGALYTFFRSLGDILQAPAAYLVHLAHPHAIIAGGLFWCSIGMFLATLSTSYAMLAVTFAAGGIGRAPYHPLAATLLSRVFGRESLGRAIALHMSGSSLGQVAAPFLVGLLLTYYGWRLPIVLWSALGLLAGLSLFFLLKRQKESFSAPRKALRLPFFSRPMAVYLLAVSIWGIAQAGLMTFLPLFLVDNRGLSKEKAAAVYGMMSLSSVVFRPFIGAVMDRMGRRKPVLVGGFIISALSIFGLASIRSMWMMYLFIVLLGTFGSGHSGLSDTFLIEMIPSSRREETLGATFTVRTVIAAPAPFIVGFASERLGLPTVFLILSAVPIFTALVLAMAEEKPHD
jgi:FSR family fosmidomycin resistance protein-like MFS transporter